MLVGVGTGVLSGMFGVGGAVLSTPGIRLLGASPLIAIGSTLPSVLPSAAVGTVTYTRERLVEVRVALVAGGVGAAFAVAAARLTTAIPGDGHLQQIATAALLSFSSWRLVRSAHEERPDLARPAEARPAEETIPTELGREAAPRGFGAWTLAVTGAAAGSVSGLLGIGGGVILVPAFVEVLRLPIKRAVATSLVVVGILAVPGTITHAVLGNIDWRFALWLTVGVIPGARLGSGITVGARERTIRLFFGLFLLVLSIVYGLAEVLSLARA